MRCRYRCCKCFLHFRFYLGLRFPPFSFFFPGIGFRLNFVSSVDFMFGIFFFLWILRTWPNARITYSDSCQPQESFYFIFTLLCFFLVDLGFSSFKYEPCCVPITFLPNWVHFRAGGRLVYGIILERTRAILEC